MQWDGRQEGIHFGAAGLHLFAWYAYYRHVVDALWRVLLLLFVGFYDVSNFTWRLLVFVLGRLVLRVLRTVALLRVVRL